MNMIQNIDAPISVLFKSDHRQKKSYPLAVTWEGRDYKVVKVGLHHTYYVGKNLFHIYSIQTLSIFFKLKLDTSTMQWRVEQICDDETN